MSTEYKYPMWFKSTDSNLVVKFHSLHGGEVIVSDGTEFNNVGKVVNDGESPCFIEHTDSGWINVTDRYKEKEESDKFIASLLDDGTIEEIQKERGSVYGKFDAQCECVGKIVSALIDCSVANNGLQQFTFKQVGAYSYIAIKLARYAVSPSHVDTLTDLMIYCKLIRQMETGKDCKIEDINT